MPSWLRLKDNIPEKVDAIYVPGMCLTFDKSRLTAANHAMISEASRLTKEVDVGCLVMAGCYDDEVSSYELQLRFRVLKDAGFDLNKVRTISGITDTVNELSKLSAVLENEGARSVLIVSNDFHMPRAVRWARILLASDIKIFHKSVPAPRYEFPYEPSRIKVIRFGFKPLWIAWNVLMYLATPLIVRLP